MFYKYDKNQLIFKRDWRTIKIIIGVIVVLSISSFSAGYVVKKEPITAYEKEILILNLEKQQNEFSKNKLVYEIKRLNIRFPYIVLAQSIIETGHWTSQIFKENNNLFGMRQAPGRINTAKGTQNEHALYDDWKQSVYDYAFYSCLYLKNIETEEQYFNYLSSVYAEAGDKYTIELKKVIQDEKLKELF